MNLGEPRPQPDGFREGRVGGFSSICGRGEREAVVDTGGADAVGRLAVAFGLGDGEPTLESSGFGHLPAAPADHPDGRFGPEVSGECTHRHDFSRADRRRGNSQRSVHGCGRGRLLSCGYQNGKVGLSLGQATSRGYFPSPTRNDRILRVKVHLSHQLTARSRHLTTDSTPPPHHPTTPPPPTFPEFR